MADCEEQIFIDTDVDIILNPKAGFVLADVTDMVVTLTHSKAAQPPITYSLGSGIVISVGQIFLLILKGDILQPGCYNLTVRLFDNTIPTPKERGLSPCVLPDETDFLKFFA